MSDGANNVKPKGQRQEVKANYFSLFTFWFLLFALLLSAGCNQKQQAVDLYVDAIMLRELDENEMAVKRLNSAVKLDKRFSLAYSLLGEVYQEMKQYEKSAASYEKATQFNPLSFNDFFSLGRVYEIMKRFVQAVRAYARACEIKPNHLQAHISTAKCYYQISDYNRALIYGKRAEQIDPNVSEIQNLLGDIYGSQEDYEQAIRSYKRSLELDSNNPTIMTSLAVAYLKTNRNEPAREVLESVIQIQPDNNIAYKHLGYCCLLLKDIDKSIENYSKAIQINENDWDSLRGLGVAYILKGTAEDGTLDETLKAKAVQQWRRSLDIKPDQPNSERVFRLIRKYSEKKE